MRVYELAILLGVISPRVTAYLRSLGMPIHSPSCMIGPILAATVIAHFGA